jgi:hypothetical protein
MNLPLFKLASESYTEFLVELSPEQNLVAAIKTFDMNSHVKMESVDLQNSKIYELDPNARSLDELIIYQFNNKIEGTLEGKMCYDQFTETLLEDSANGFFLTRSMPPVDPSDLLRMMFAREDIVV